MKLATSFHPVYWNTSCLIINAGGAELLEAEDMIEEEEEEDKKKNKSVNYGKISIAIGESKNTGLIVLPPDINKSKLIFTPDVEKNAILYGMKGINRIGTQLVFDIFKNRPYTSVEDFLSKVKVNKTQMINLIKAGVFDSLYPDKSREKIMEDYIWSIADQKKRITLQNMQMLIAKDLIPLELDFEKRLFNFNKYIKKAKVGDEYKLDPVAMRFFKANYDQGALSRFATEDNNEIAFIKCSTWDNTYQKGMDPVRAWMKKNQTEILNDLNNKLFEETAEKYTEGNLSKWEMDSLGFYYHEHELQSLMGSVYDIADFNSLSKEPEIDRSFKTKDGNEINLFKISRICGTVIDKDKNKSSVTLLTPTGVVTVKVWKNQYAAWDRQLSERGADGVKHVVEKSWFQRGTKLIITGIRRDDNFIPKKYKNTEHPLFEKVISMDEKGFITESVTERTEVE